MLVGKMGSAFRGPDIKTELDQIRRAADRVKASAAVAGRDVAMNTYHNTEATRKTVTLTQLQVDSMEQALSTVTQGMSELGQRHQFVLQQLNQALNSQTDMFQMLKEALLSLSAQ